MRLDLTAIVIALAYSVISSNSYATDECPASYPDQAPFNLKSCYQSDVLQWDERTLIEQLAEGGEHEITLQGGKANYTFSLTSEGFSIIDENGEEQTVLTTSAITVKIRSNTRCGSVEIQVLDKCKNSLSHTIRSTEGRWVKTNCFLPISRKETGPHPYLDPRTLGMRHIGQTVAYKMSIPGYGTRFKGKYALQVQGISPESYADFGFNTGNSWGWGYYDDSLVDDPRSFFMDPIVGVFRIRAFGGTQHRGPNYHKYYCATSLCIWEWTCQ